MTEKTHLGKQEETIEEKGVQLRSSDPLVPDIDQLWVNTTVDEMRYYDGSIIKTVSAGSQGATGVMGDTGVMGPTGTVGETGIGMQGDTGLMGPTGPASGPQGATGLRGITGP
jgi:hypothetical protein